MNKNYQTRSRLCRADRPKVRISHKLFVLFLILASPFVRGLGGIPILIIDAHEGAGEGEGLAVGGEDGRVDRAHGRDEERRDDESYPEASGSDCRHQLDAPLGEVFHNEIY